MGGAFPEATEGSRTSGALPQGELNVWERRDDDYPPLWNPTKGVGNSSKVFELADERSLDCSPADSRRRLIPPPTTVAEKNRESSEHTLSRSAASAPAAGRSPKG